MNHPIALLLSTLSLLASLAACSSGNTTESAPTRKLGAENGGATIPPDNAPGVCCPAENCATKSLEDAAQSGGYEARGVCPSPEGVTILPFCGDVTQACSDITFRDEHGCAVRQWGFNCPYEARLDAGADSGPHPADASPDAR